MSRRRSSLLVLVVVGITPTAATPAPALAPVTRLPSAAVPVPTAPVTCSIYDSDWACPPYCTWDGKSCIVPPTLVVSEASWLTSRTYGAACSNEANGADGEYHLEGFTASGAPFYRSVSRNQHLYYDPSCDGGKASARWIFDNVAPNTAAVSNLSGRGACKFWAYLENHVVTGPPAMATWQMACGGVWRDVEINIFQKCSDTEYFATDVSGQGCDSPVYPANCGAFDDADFFAASMCCACGGGTRVMEASKLEQGERAAAGVEPAMTRTSTSTISTTTTATTTELASNSSAKHAIGNRSNASELAGSAENGSNASIERSGQAASSGSSAASPMRGQRDAGTRIDTNASQAKPGSSSEASEVSSKEADTNRSGDAGDGANATHQLRSDYHGSTNHTDLMPKNTPTNHTNDTRTKIIVPAHLDSTNHSNHSNRSTTSSSPSSVRGNSTRLMHSNESALVDTSASWPADAELSQKFNAASPTVVERLALTEPGRAAATSIRIGTVALACGSGFVAVLTLRVSRSAAPPTTDGPLFMALPTEDDDDWRRAAWHA